MTFFVKLNDLLFHPDAFFAQLEHEEVNLVPPVLIVMLSGIGAVLTGGLAMILSGSFAGLSEEEILVTLFTSSPFIMAFLLQVLMWIVASVSVWLVAGKLSGTGTLTATLQNIGYGMLPTMIYTVISQVLVMATMTITGGTSYSGMMAGAGLMLLALSLVITIWTWYLWVSGIVHAHQITREKAIVAVIVVIIVQWIVAILVMAFPVVWSIPGPQSFLLF